MRRRDRAALLAGIGLAILHVCVAIVLAHTAGTPARPIYDGPCPPTTCTPCPQLHCPTYSPPPPYTEPPSSSSSSSSSSRSSTSSGTSSSRSSSTSTSSSVPGSSSAVSSAAVSSASTGPGGATPDAGASSSTGGGVTGSGSAQSQGASTAAPTAPSQAVVGPEGGTVASPDGELTIRVPAGALTRPATMRILSAAGIAPEPPAGRSAAGRPWDVGGSDATGPVTVFSKPVEITVRWTDVEPQFIEYWDGSAWENLETSVDRGARTATASVPHLTVFEAFGAPVAADQGGHAGRVLAAAGVAVVAAIAAVAWLRTRVLRRRPGPTS